MGKLSLLSLIWFHSAMLFIYSRASNAKERHNAFVLLSSLHMQEFVNKLSAFFVTNSEFSPNLHCYCLEHLPLLLAYFLLLPYDQIVLCRWTFYSTKICALLPVKQRTDGAAKGWSRKIREIDVMLQIGTKKWK